MTASRATQAAVPISSKLAPGNARLPAAAKVPADRIPSTRASSANHFGDRDSFAVTALADIIDRSR